MWFVFILFHTVFCFSLQLFQSFLPHVRPPYLHCFGNAPLFFSPRPAWHGYLVQIKIIYVILIHKICVNGKHLSRMRVCSVCCRCVRQEDLVVLWYFHISIYFYFILFFGDADYQPRHPPQTVNQKFMQRNVLENVACIEVRFSRGYTQHTTHSNVVCSLIWSRNPNTCSRNRHSGEFFQLAACTN